MAAETEDPMNVLLDEILLIIFHLLSKGDRDRSNGSLVSCSLVSKAWRRSTAPFLFSHIAIGPSEGHSFHDFLHFLQARPELVRYCRCMRVSRVEDFDFATFLSQVMVHLPSLKHLALDTVPIRLLDEAFRPDVAAFELSTLKLADIYDPDRGATTTEEDAPWDTKPMDTVLHSLPLSRVGCLNLVSDSESNFYDYYYPRFGSRSTECPDLHAGSNMTSIDNIVVGGDDCNTAVFEALEKVIRPGSLLRLTAKCRRHTDLVGLAAFLRRVAGANLKQLDIKLTTFMEDEQRESMNNNAYVGPWSTFKDAVSACPTLERMHIGILPYAINAFREGEAPFVPERYRLFTSIADALPPTFRKFMLSLHTWWDSPDWGRCIELWDLKALDALADERRYARFEGLLVCMAEWPDCEVEKSMQAAEERTKTLLPRLHKAKKIEYGWDLDEVARRRKSGRGMFGGLFL
ncbi:hypothetical protein K466DRAFT_659227 [Polyporus arcularius HHB13444]|uniref:Uncharacterized protein n=1 Tax=Polyporus arcularius HHB13444 TaxID=1314778 RepID=A0A5C3PRS3_9APHY|nr:hypothetical protein K466DRAFT_659227 [Polyporus arcularius HHB13444]